MFKKSISLILLLCFVVTVIPFVNANVNGEITDASSEDTTTVEESTVTDETEVIDDSQNFARGKTVTVSNESVAKG